MKPEYRRSRNLTETFHDFSYPCRPSPPTPPPNLAPLETYQDGLAFLPNSANLIFIAFVVLYNQEG